MKTSMKECAFAVAGFGVASVVPPLGLALISPLGSEFSLQSVAATFLVLYPFAAAAVAILGLPAFLLLRPYRPGRWWSVVAVGFVLGMLTAIVVQLPNFPGSKTLLLFGSLGALSALSFWLVWKRGANGVRRPVPAAK